MGHCSASWQEKKKGHGKLRMALKGISWKVKYRCMAVVFWVLFCKADINSAKQQCFFVYRPLEWPVNMSICVSAS